MVLTMHVDSETESITQGSFYTLKIKWPDDKGCSEQPKLSECIRAAQEAWHRLSSGHTRQDWLLVGKACQLLRVEAMRTAHTDNSGPRAVAITRNIPSCLKRTVLPASIKPSVQSCSSSSTTSLRLKNGWRPFPPTSG